MRRLFVLLIALALVGSMAGCHTGGICDCDWGCACAPGSPPTGTPLPWLSGGGSVVETMPAAHAR